MNDASTYRGPCFTKTGSRTTVKGRDWLSELMLHPKFHYDTELLRAPPPSAPVATALAVRDSPSKDVPHNVPSYPSFWMVDGKASMK